MLSTRLNETLLVVSFTVQCKLFQGSVDVAAPLWLQMEANKAHLHIALCPSKERFQHAGALTVQGMWRALQNADVSQITPYITVTVCQHSDN